MLKKCFGIISWFSDDPSNKIERQKRINRLFTQLENLWPDIDILVIAQNWKDFTPIRTTNKQIILKYEALGILGARKTLREEFLKLDYDYIIMFDDDAIIECSDKSAAKNFIKLIDNHPHGFCFMPGNDSPYHPYCGAQLNLCAISKFIYKEEPMIEIDAQKNEGFEDSIYACLLHHKWGKYEFNPPSGIKPIQFQVNNEIAKSTWWDSSRPGALMLENTRNIEKYIAEHKCLPLNYRDTLKHSENIKLDHQNKKDITADGRPNTYLYF